MSNVSRKVVEAAWLGWVTGLSTALTVHHWATGYDLFWSVFVTVGTALLVLGCVRLYLLAGDGR